MIISIIINEVGMVIISFIINDADGDDDDDSM